MLVLGRVAPRIKISRTQLYTRMKKTVQIPWPGLEHGPLDLGTSLRVFKPTAPPTTVIYIEATNTVGSSDFKWLILDF